MLAESASVLMLAVPGLRDSSDPAARPLNVQGDLRFLQGVQDGRWPSHYSTVSTKYLLPFALSIVSVTYCCLFDATDITCCLHVHALPLRRRWGRLARIRRSGRTLWRRQKRFVSSAHLELKFKSR